MTVPQHIDSSMIAPCGVNCDVCDIHLQDKKSCHSCMKLCGNKPAICEKCSIANCARSKGVAYCHECEDFPCLEIKNMELSFQDKYRVSMIASSHRLKNIGMEAYLKQERSKMEL